jgi:hypothetical protein
MRNAALEGWVERARMVRIESEIARRGIKLKRVTKHEYAGPCPQCGGEDRFSINTEKQVFNCRQCGGKGDVIDMVKWLDGTEFNEACETLTREPPPKANGKDDPASEARECRTAKFAYHDQNGDLVFVVERIEYQNPDGTFVLKNGKRKKSFRQKRPGPGGQWINNVNGRPIIPYRLPQLSEAVALGQTIIVVEGEAKADLLWIWNVPATCNAQGAGQWKTEHSEFLRGADVVILPDNDEQGRKHCDVVGRSLQGIAASTRVLDLPGLPEKGDILNWATAGGTVEQLHELIAREAIPWTTGGPESTSQNEAPPPIIKTSGEFIAGFVPPDYILDGLLQEGFLYSLTGQTGSGKTSVTLRLAASVALGAPFAGRETKKSRVLCLAAENPDDVRMRWIALAQHMVFDPDTIEVFFTDKRFTISKTIPMLRAELARHGGEFGLVIIDTGPAFFEGDDESSRAQMGVHARMFRSLIDIIPGRPCIIVNCHPVKNAAIDNLCPAGGGSFVNEMDGNLTAAKTDSTVELHWQVKFRGPEFAPLHFLIKTVTHQDLKDRKGRLIPTCICEWVSEQATEEIAAQKTADEDQVLDIVSRNPTASYASIATAMGWKLYSGEPHKSKAKRRIDALVKAKLVKVVRDGSFQVTKDGKQVLKEVPAA